MGEGPTVFSEAGKICLINSCWHWRNYASFKSELTGMISPTANCPNWSGSLITTSFLHHRRQYSTPLFQVQTKSQQRTKISFGFMWWKYKISSIIFWFDSNKFYEGSSNFVATFSIKPSFSHQTCKRLNCIKVPVGVRIHDIIL